MQFVVARRAGVRIRRKGVRHPLVGRAPLRPILKESTFRRLIQDWPSGHIPWCSRFIAGWCIVDQWRDDAERRDARSHAERGNEVR